MNNSVCYPPPSAFNSLQSNVVDIEHFGGMCIINNVFCINIISSIIDSNFIMVSLALPHFPILLPIYKK